METTLTVMFSYVPKCEIRCAVAMADATASVVNVNRLIMVWKGNCYEDWVRTI